MEKYFKWPNLLASVGLVLIALGTIDPFEGSVAIVFGIGLAALAAWLDKSPRFKPLRAALALAAAGVAALFVLSSHGGVGGNSGRSYFWLVAVLPYPAGWYLGIVNAIKKLKELPRDAAGPNQRGMEHG